MKIKKDDKILLVGEKNYLLKAGEIFSSQYGNIDLKKIVGKNYGAKIRSSKGNEFVVVKPSLTDMIYKFRRGPQVIPPKDSAAILAVTGCSPGWTVVDAGSGSGFLSIFLANYIRPGKIYTYEIRKDFHTIAKNNIKRSGLKNIVIKNKDITKGITEKNVDMITLDLEHPEDVIKHAFNSLKIGGWLVIYSMHIEQIQKSYKEIKKYNFTEPKIIENMFIEWQMQGKSNTFTRPKTHLGHTGFLTFVRKI